MLLNTPIKISKNAPGPHVLDQLAAYLDYELPEDQRAVVREHLRRCPQCENELATLRATKQLLRDLPEIAPPRSFRLSPELVAAANKQAVAAPLPLGRARMPRLVLALRGSAACLFVLLLLLVGTDLTNRPNAVTLTAAYAPPADTAPAAAREMQQAQLQPATAQPAAAAPTSTTAAAAAAQVTDTAAPAAAANAPAPNAPPQPSIPVAAQVPQATPAAGGASSGAGGPPLNPQAAGTSATGIAGTSADMATAAAAEVPPAPASAKMAPTEGTFSTQSSAVNPTSALSTPAANPPLLQWLPWEVVLGLLTLAAAGASIFAARNR